MKRPIQAVDQLDIVVVKRQNVLKARALGDVVGPGCGQSKEGAPRCSAAIICSTLEKHYSFTHRVLCRSLRIWPGLQQRSR